MVDNVVILWTVAVIATWYFLLRSKVPVWKLVGSLAFILLGFTTLGILNTGPASVVTAVMVAIGGIHFFETVVDITSG